MKECILLISEYASFMSIKRVFINPVVDWISLLQSAEQLSLWCYALRCYCLGEGRLPYTRREGDNDDTLADAYQPIYVLEQFHCVFSLAHGGFHDENSQNRAKMCCKEIICETIYVCTVSCHKIRYTNKTHMSAFGM